MPSQIYNNSSKKSSSITAFSLVEISMVILIIGILVAGISKGLDLYNEFNLVKARNITKGSRVGRISNLDLWLETSLEESFRTSERYENSSISSWLDINIQASQKKSVSQATSTSQPKFIPQAFNKSIPAVRFDGNNDYFPFDSSSMNGSDFTIFVVEQRTTGGINSYYIGGGSNGVFHMGYSGSSTIRVGQYGSAGVNFFDYAVAQFSSSQIITRMHTFILTSANGKKYWLNGGTSPEASSANNSLLSQYSGNIGVTELGASNLYYTGDIGEIIIYSKELTTAERNEVELYLSKKYGIPIS